MREYEAHFALIKSKKDAEIAFGFGGLEKRECEEVFVCAELLGL